MRGLSRASLARLVSGLASMLLSMSLVEMGASQLSRPWLSDEQQRNDGLRAAL